MKNTDPPSQNKFKKLNPELIRFIENMGLYFETQGVPRIGGRILGLLLVAHEPLSAEDIGAILKVSRASISTNIRLLTSSGLVEKTSSLHDRATYFIFSETAWEQAMQVGVQKASVLKSLIQQGLTALPEKDSARERLNRSIQWADLVVEFYQELHNQWSIKYPALVKGK
jgi:DNA-binding transcriptional regulator GbsR (MarR family)